MNRLNVGIVGATGAVGQELLHLLDARNFPLGDVKAFASPLSAGSILAVGSNNLLVEDVLDGSFEGLDLAFFSAGASRSRLHIPSALAAGTLVIDNSSAFRMEEGVPLIVPEINADALKKEHRLIANPNCVAIIMLMAVAPLRKLGELKRLIVTTFQSASGAGAKAMQELQDQTEQVLYGNEPLPRVFPHACAFNLFSHNTPVDASGHNEEENKVIQETKKILGDPDIGINITCVRVPVMRAHSAAITIEFKKPAPTSEEALECLRAAPGVRIVDDREANHFPMPIEATGIDEVLVGRIRPDPSSPNALCLFVSGDQLRKGAALNAIQIAERCFGIG